MPSLYLICTTQKKLCHEFIALFGTSFHRAKIIHRENERGVRFLVPRGLAVAPRGRRTRILSAENNVYFILYILAL
jgi:hypothetical protein